MGHFQVLAAKEKDMEIHIGMVEEQQKADLKEAEKVAEEHEAMEQAKGDKLNLNKR